MKELKDFIDQDRHIPNMFVKQSAKDIVDNRLRLESTIKALRWLDIGLPITGRDESKYSSNRGNFLELLTYKASFNNEMEDVINCAPGNASYTSPDIQKEILQIFGEKIKRAIMEEIGENPYCIIFDEAGDVSLKERFFGIIHIPNTNTITLKDEIFQTLNDYCFDMKKLRGQGYDGASNMRGKWNGLQALVIRECPYAYFVHYFAHRLQLALVAAKEVIPIFQFFSKVSMIINIVLASYKRVDELRKAYSNEINILIKHGELETGTGLNQASNLQRPGDTRWSSHLSSISSLMRLYNSICDVFHNLIDEGYTSFERAQASTLLDTLTSFEFVFILHFMKKVLELSDMVSRFLQRKSQDILNSMHLVENTKILLQKLRDDGWESLVTEVISFCESRNIELVDMSAIYIERGGRARRQHNQITIEDHYRMNLFFAGINIQLQELDHKFNEHSVQLLTLSCSLEPRASGRFFNLDTICNLVNKFYQEDFTDTEKEDLRVELGHYEVELSRYEDIKNLTTISDLSEWLVHTGKMDMYPLIFRLAKLLLTLHVSTASAERAFSAMNIVKTTRRNKKEAEFF